MLPLLVMCGALAGQAGGVAVGPECADRSGEWVCVEGEIVPLTKDVRDDYEAKFHALSIDADWRDDVELIVTRIMRSREQYAQVAQATAVPWFLVAVIHQMECDGNFRCHLHNGDPLQHRTVNEPKGRPLAPPANGKSYTWLESAIDAMRVDGFDAWRDWSVAGALFKLEAYNGMGYRKRGLVSPYLFGGTQFYVSGKFVRDGVFDSHAKSEQTGAAALLRRLIDQHLIDWPEAAPATAPAGGTR